MRTKKTRNKPATLLLLLTLAVLLAASNAGAASFRLIYGNDILATLDSCG